MNAKEEFQTKYCCLFSGGKKTLFSFLNELNENMGSLEREIPIHYGYTLHTGVSWLLRIFFVKL